ncbi:hypothetical protein Tco_0972247 [Tanacetum coccineum]
MIQINHLLALLQIVIGNSWSGGFLRWYKLIEIAAARVIGNRWSGFEWFKLMEHDDGGDDDVEDDDEVEEVDGEWRRRLAITRR